MAVITPIPKTQFIGADGVPLVGGKVYTYAAGTTTPQVTYTDSTGSTANSNPIILDSRGEANIWLGEATYKFKLLDANNVEIWTVDYISAPTTAVSPVLTGNVTISTDSSGPALKITQTGTGDVLRVQDSVDPDITPFVINSAGLVGLGTVAPAEALDIDNDGKIQFSASGTARTVISADASNSTIDVKDNRNFLVKTNGGTRVTVSGAGATTLAGALTVSSGGATIVGNSSITGTLGVSSTLTAQNGLTVSAGGASVTGNSTVTGTLTATSTLTAQNGLTVSAGGAGITGTLTANNGVSVPSGGVNVTGTVTATTFSGAWANIPSGTVMLFVQTAAPTGWTKSTTHDNKALRVVSGSASSGGSVAFTSAFASQSVTGTNASYTLQTADIPSHTHTATVSDSGHTHNTYGYIGNFATGTAGSVGRVEYLTNGSSGANTTGTSSSNTTGISVSNSSTGGGGGHTHTFTGTAINLAVQYVDVIIATKD